VIGALEDAEDYQAFEPATATTTDGDEDLRQLSDQELIEKLLISDGPVITARNSFVDFRCYVDPKIIMNWWVHETSEHLQEFYNGIIAGKRPKLAIMTPSQHGKSPRT
jgi:hypothetical protein